MSESSAEKQGTKSSKLALANTKEGIATIKGVADRFAQNPALGKIAGLENQILDNPFTYNQQYRDSVANDASAGALKQSENAGGQYGALAERLGLGRSQAGGGGFANLASLMGTGGVINANQQTDRIMAEQRLKDLNNAIGGGFNFLTQLLGPQKEVGLAQLGTLGGLSSLTGANAQLASQQSGPLDFLGSAVGAGLGGLTGGLGGLGAKSLFGATGKSLFGN